MRLLLLLEEEEAANGCGQRGRLVVAQLALRVPTAWKHTQNNSPSLLLLYNR